MENFSIDLHQKLSDVCRLSESGEVVFQQRSPTTEARLRRVFGKRSEGRIILESSYLVPWVSRLLKGMGHDVLVVNPRQIRLIAESTLKCDRFTPVWSATAAASRYAAANRIYAS